jgi:hypothetical protein
LCIEKGRSNKETEGHGKIGIKGKKHSVVMEYRRRRRNTKQWGTPI